MNKFVRNSTLTAALVMVVGLPAAWADELSVKAVESESPQELGESIRTALGTEAIQVLDGEKPVAEFWFRKELPITKKPDSPDSALKTLEEATLVGVVRLNEERRDFRDDRAKAGVYTLRFALQPQDGDHMGTSPTPYFVLLTGAEMDKELDGPEDHEALVTMAKGKAHPRNFNLRPATSSDGEFPRIEDGVDETKIVQLKVPAVVKDSGENVDIVIGLVVEGHGEI